MEAGGLCVCWPAPAWHNLHIQPEIAAANGRFAWPLPRIPQMFQPVRDFWNVSCCRAYDSRGVMMLQLGWELAASVTRDASLFQTLGIALVCTSDPEPPLSPMQSSLFQVMSPHPAARDGYQNTSCWQLCDAATCKGLAPANATWCAASQSVLLLALLPRSAGCARFCMYCHHSRYCQLMQTNKRHLPLLQEPHAGRWHLLHALP